MIIPTLQHFKSTTIWLITTALLASINGQDGYFESTLPGISNIIGGNCVLINKKIYYLGGKVQTIKPPKPTTTNVTKIKRRADVNIDLQPNNKTFPLMLRILDLTKKFNLTEDGEAPWLDGNTNLNTYQPVMYSMLADKGENRSNIIMVGGFGSTNITNSTSDDNNFKYFDTDTLNFSPNSKGSNMTLLKKGLGYGTFVKGDLNLYDYYLFGGINTVDIISTLNTNPAALASSSYVYKFDTKTEVWSQHSVELGEPSFLHSSTVIEGKMYVMGGIDPFTLKPYAWDRIRIYDLAEKKWFNATTENNDNEALPLSRFGHRSLAWNNDTIVIIGGSNGFNNLNQTNIKINNNNNSTLPGNITTIANESGKSRINTNKLMGPNASKLKRLSFPNDVLLYHISSNTFTRITLDQFEGTYLGCAAIHNNYLVYSFGQSNNNTTKRIGKTSLIDLNTFSLTNQYLNQSKKDVSKVLTPGIKTLLGFSIFLGILLLLLLVAFLVYRLKIYILKSQPIHPNDFNNKREKYSSSNENLMPPPQWIDEPLWSPSNLLPQSELLEDKSLLNLSRPKSSQESLLNRGVTGVDSNGLDKVTHLASLDNGVMKVPTQDESSKLLDDEVIREERLAQAYSVKPGGLGMPPSWDLNDLSRDQLFVGNGNGKSRVIVDQFPPTTKFIDTQYMTTNSTTSVRHSKDGSIDSNFSLPANRASDGGERSLRNVTKKWVEGKRNSDRSNQSHIKRLGYEDSPNYSSPNTAHPNSDSITPFSTNSPRIYPVIAYSPVNELIEPNEETSYQSQGSKDIVKSSCSEDIELSDAISPYEKSLKVPSSLSIIRVEEADEERVTTPPKVLLRNQLKGDSDDRLLRDLPSAGKNRGKPQIRVGVRNRVKVRYTRPGIIDERSRGSPGTKLSPEQERITDPVVSRQSSLIETKSTLGPKSSPLPKISITNTEHNQQAYMTNSTLDGDTKVSPLRKPKMQSSPLVNSFHPAKPDSSTLINSSQEIDPSLLLPNPNTKLKTKPKNCEGGIRLSKSLSFGLVHDTSFNPNTHHMNKKKVNEVEFRPEELIRTNTDPIISHSNQSNPIAENNFYKIGEGLGVEIDSPTSKFVGSNESNTESIPKQKSDLSSIS